MKRLLFGLLVGLSLLLCAATIVLWVQSYSVRNRLLCVRYFTHVHPAWVLLQGFDSDEGDLIYIQAFVECMNSEEAGRSGPSDFGDIVVDNGNLPGPRTSSWVWQGHADLCVYVRKPETALNHLGIYDIWEFGYNNLGWSRSFFLPYWLPAVIFGLLPIRTVIRYALRQVRFFTGRRQITHNRCPSGRYDLRATPERCPECGTVPEKIA